MKVNDKRVVCMKSLTFGKTEIIKVENISKYLLWNSSFYMTLIRCLENISFTREIYNEKRHMNRIVNTVSDICNHDDVYHVDIYIDKGNKEDFITDLSNIMELTFGAAKSSNVIISNKTKFCFEDGYSNPCFDENFMIDVRWKEWIQLKKDPFDV